MFQVTNFERRHLLRIAAIAGVGALVGLIGCATQEAKPFVFQTLFSKGEFPSLGGATTWLNSPALTPAELRGKVVLVQFWTYTCINWLRTLPYVRAWAEKYKDQGLVVIGVHTPEFSFEKNLDNIRREAKSLGVEYPIAVDSDYAVWNAFGNAYWPALYFVDAQGQIRHHHFGEGEYEKSEMVIQRLLAETGSRELRDEVVAVDPQGLEVAADWSSLKTPETYVGYSQAAGFASPGGMRWDQAHVYELPAQLRLNQWALSGDWTDKRESAVLNEPNGRIAFRFHARDVNLVMGPATPGASIHFRVFIDGKPAGAVHGADVDGQGNGTFSTQRTYQLIRQKKPIQDRLFEIEFLDSGAEVFCFTFG